MAGLTHNEQYPCLFDLKLSEWGQYATVNNSFDVKTTELGEPYTLRVKYRMALQVGDCILYQSKKDNTLILEDIMLLIKGLQQLTNGNKDRLAFDPIEPDFGLVIRNLTESNASVIISSAAEIRAEMPTGAVNKSDNSTSLFDINVWVDYPNQVNRFYGGYGPGLYFTVEDTDIIRFARQLQDELDGLGTYFSKTNSQ